MKKIEVTKNAQKHLKHFKKDQVMIKKIKTLIEAIQQDPFEGIGRPEALKYNFQGYWSRRINLEHRLIYEVKDDRIVIVSCKGHYDE